MTMFNIIERPQKVTRAGRRSELVNQLLLTLDSGKALCVALNGRTASSVYSSFYVAVRRVHGTTVRMRTSLIDKEHQAYWLEQK